MANNALIQGAAQTGKKFLDVGGAVAKGLQNTAGYNESAASAAKNRVAENNAVKAQVNNYMSKMKTDMDFTSFSPSETKTMRNFLLAQRTKYAEAAKMASKFDDMSDPNYMLYVDQMQEVNNSFTNLASQLKSYKKGKLDFAQTMQEGLYSSGNPTEKDDNPIKDASIIYGFYDSNKDGKSDDNYDAPFQIQDGGNIGFNVRGKEITYNNMREPFLKDTKFLNSLTASSEKAYNAGTRGGTENPYALAAYKESLNNNLQSEDALRSIIFDFGSEAPMEDIASALDNGTITLEDARSKVVQKLTTAREQAFNQGKNAYNAKKVTSPASSFTANDTQQLKVVNDKIKLLEGGSHVRGRGNASDRGVVLYEGEYYPTNSQGQKLGAKAMTKDEVIESLNLNVKGLNWK